MASVAPTGRVTLAGQRQQVMQTAHHRLMVMMLIFLGLIGFIALRLFWLALFTDAPSARAIPTRCCPRAATSSIRNGVPLAVTIKAWTIALHPDRVDPVNRVEVAEKLAQVLPERTAAQYLALLQSGSHFVYLRRRALPATVEAVNAIGSTAIELTREPERLYPQTGSPATSSASSTATGVA